MVPHLSSSHDVGKDGLGEHVDLFVCHIAGWKKYIVSEKVSQVRDHLVQTLFRMNRIQTAHVILGHCVDWKLNFPGPLKIDQNRFVVQYLFVHRIVKVIIICVELKTNQEISRIFTYCPYFRGVVLWKCRRFYYDFDDYTIKSTHTNPQNFVRGFPSLSLESSVIMQFQECEQVLRVVV